MKVFNLQHTLQVLLFGGLCLAPLLLHAQDADDAALVTVTKVVAEDMSPVIPAAGTVFSRNATQITAGLAGRIDWIAEPGDFIEAGAAVALFDCDMLELRREELQAQAERLESLLDSHVVAETQLARLQGDRDLAASEFRIARVRIRQTETELERCAATAPFGGVVTERFRTTGEDVERSTVLAAMTDIGNLEVRASVPIRYLPRIQTGDIVEVRMSEMRFEGRIRKAVPAGDPLSQTFQVRIDLPEAAPGFVAAGQLVSVLLPLSTANVMTVPRDSIVLREDGTFVMRINGENKVERVTIEVADANGQRVAVRGELKPGDRVAVRGAEALDHGELVAVHSET
jgi:RND family efflux transporter MFP subunit